MSENRISLRLLKQKYPVRTMPIWGHDFAFRYHKNAASDKTIVLLTGGIGLADLLLYHFDALAESYSVLTFDYQLAYTTNQQLVDAIAVLLKTLECKGFLAGQSYGGFVAQILARQHPEVVSGLILSNTGTLSVDLDIEGRKCLYDMLKRVDHVLRLVEILPFGFVRKNVSKEISRKLGSNPSMQQRALAQEMREEVEHAYTKELVIHMARLFKDLQNHWNMTASDFTRYKGKVLLLLSRDDPTFCDDVKQELIHIMPNPQVRTDICGGHLALMLNPKVYDETIQSFLGQIP